MGLTISHPLTLLLFKDTVNSVIETEMKRLQTEVVVLAEDERGRIQAIITEVRRDILTQTLTLHGLFRAGEEGGRFALMAYAILAG